MFFIFGYTIYRPPVSVPVANLPPHFVLRCGRPFVIRLAELAVCRAVRVVAALGDVAGAPSVFCPFGNFCWLIVPPVAVAVVVAVAIFVISSAPTLSSWPGCCYCGDDGCCRRCWVVGWCWWWVEKFGRDGCGFCDCCGELCGADHEGHIVSFWIGNLPGVYGSWTDR